MADKQSPTDSVSVHSDRVLPNFDVDDELHSMESKFKEFEFPQLGFTNENLKCIDFWKLIKEQKIKPAPPSFKDPHYARSNNDGPPNFAPPVREEPVKDCECYVWCKALYELQKRNLDKVAVAAMRKPNLDKPCRYCKDIQNTVEVPKIRDNLSILNTFMDSGSESVEPAPKLTKTTQTSFSEIHVQGHPIVGKVRTYTSVYDPTVTFFSDDCD